LLARRLDSSAAAAAALCAATAVAVVPLRLVEAAADGDSMLLLDSIVSFLSI
jgi:hypothetical protein